MTAPMNAGMDASTATPIIIRPVHRTATVTTAQPSGTTTRLPTPAMRPVSGPANRCEGQRQRPICRPRTGRPPPPPKWSAWFSTLPRNDRMEPPADQAGGRPGGPVRRDPHGHQGLLPRKPLTVGNGRRDGTGRSLTAAESTRLPTWWSRSGTTWTPAARSSRPGTPPRWTAWHCRRATPSSSFTSVPRQARAARRLSCQLHHRLGVPFNIASYARPPTCPPT